MNSWINQYLLGLGEFSSIDAYEGENATFTWIMFLMATFIIQITFLNMLIAIMGDTFDRVVERKQASARREKLDILNEYKVVTKYISTVQPF